MMFCSKRNRSNEELVNGDGFGQGIPNGSAAKRTKSLFERQSQGADNRPPNSFRPVIGTSLDAKSSFVGNSRPHHFGTEYPRDGNGYSFAQKHPDEYQDNLGYNRQRYRSQSPPGRGGYPYGEADGGYSYRSNSPGSIMGGDRRYRGDAFSQPSGGGGGSYGSWSAGRASDSIDGYDGGRGGDRWYPAGASSSGGGGYDSRDGYQHGGYAHDNGPGTAFHEGRGGRDPFYRDGGDYHPAGGDGRDAAARYGHPDDYRYDHHPSSAPGGAYGGSYGTNGGYSAVPYFHAQPVLPAAQPSYFQRSAFAERPGIGNKGFGAATAPGGKPVLAARQYSFGAKKNINKNCLSPAAKKAAAARTASLAGGATTGPTFSAAMEAERLASEERRKAEEEIERIRSKIVAGEWRCMLWCISWSDDLSVLQMSHSDSRWRSAWQ